MIDKTWRRITISDFGMRISDFVLVEMTSYHFGRRIRIPCPLSAVLLRAMTDS